MERIRTEEEDDEDEDEELFPFLLKDWRDSCLVIASITEAGTFTGNKTENAMQMFSVVSVKGFIILTKSINKLSANCPEYVSLRLKKNPGSRQMCKSHIFSHEPVKIYYLVV